MRQNSVWSEDAAARYGGIRTALDRDIKTDVLIIGAGLAGVLTAHKLMRGGVKCVVADAGTAGGGVTQNTTAKITAQHGLIYADLIEELGFERAQLYLNANLRAIEEYRALDKEYPCDFEEKTAYVYTSNRRPRLEREASAYRSLGIAARIIDDIPLPVETAGALAMEGQAQFNPLKLLYQLSDKLDIYENTAVRRVRNGTAYTSGGSVTAGSIVLATHFPLINIPGLYFIKLYQRRSYVIALEGAALPEGMFIDERKEGYSFRTYKNLLLIGGGGHKTGKRGGGFSELRKFAGKMYPEAAEKYSWAAQDCMTLDGIPYAGRHHRGAEGLYTATGFNKWGMTGSMVSSMLLSELIISGKSEFSEVFRPNRPIFRSGLMVNMLSAAAELLSPGSPRCTHMGCKLHWNAAEGTWDCACHGSRFDKTGQIINNPAKRGIKPVKKIL